MGPTDTDPAVELVARTLCAGIGATGFRCAAIIHEEHRNAAREVLTALRRDGSAESAGMGQQIGVADLAAMSEWSRHTFGPGQRVQGVLDHIRKELNEIEENYLDVEEWADLLLLAFDGASRAGHAPGVVIGAVHAKFALNQQRRWPDWRTADPNKAIEHIRSEEPHVD